MKAKSVYRNPFSLSAMLKLLFFVAVVGSIASAFVFVRNQHVTKGIEIRNIEDRIAELDAEIEMHRLRMTRILDHRELGLEIARQEARLFGIGRDDKITIRIEGADDTVPFMVLR